MRLIIFIILLSSAQTLCYAQDELKTLLEKLDTELELRSVYDNTRLNKINTLKDIGKHNTSDLSQKYNIYNSLIDEYYPFSFDSTSYYIHLNLKLACQLKDCEKVTESQLKLSLLYATTGNHLESDNILKNDVDTTKFTPSLRKQYNIIMQRLAWELIEYTKDKELLTKARKSLEYYRQESLRNEEKNSTFSLEILEDEYLREEKYSIADSLCSILIERVAPSSHEFAKYAYQYSLAKEGLKDYYGQMVWLAKSAITDCQLGVKDYASLPTLALMLFNTNDIERAFRYINISMQDALFYNAKLRPWQIASTLPVIEKAYRDKKDSQNKKLMIFSIITITLVVILCIVGIILIIHFNKLSKARKQLQLLHEKEIEYNKDLHNVNSKLSNLNKDITEANAVKEQYIGLFLNILSENIDKLKGYENNIKKKLKYDKIEELKQDLSKSNLIEDEIEHFYITFDSTFLTLYPSFVEDFNMLLLPDERIEIKKGEMLTTELRIFALIRLGITDSSTIASLLRYSVNTIYNYRAKIKNKAKASRENFEEQIKSIGSFKA